MNIGEVLPDLSLLRVSIYHFSDSTRLRSRTLPSRAKLEGSNGGWRACARVSSGPKRAFPARTRAGLGHGTHAGRRVGFAVACRRACRSSSFTATSSIYAKNNQEIERYQLAFWQKIFMPLATAMVLLATPIGIPPGAQRWPRSACFPRRHVGIGVRGVEPEYRLLRLALRFVAGGQRLGAGPAVPRARHWCCCAVRRINNSICRARPPGAFLLAGG